MGASGQLNLRSNIVGVHFQWSLTVTNQKQVSAVTIAVSTNPDQAYVFDFNELGSEVTCMVLKGLLTDENVLKVMFDATHALAWLQDSLGLDVNTARCCIDLKLFYVMHVDAASTTPWTRLLQYCQNDKKDICGRPPTCVSMESTVQDVVHGASYALSFVQCYQCLRTQSNTAMEVATARERTVKFWTIGEAAVLAKSIKTDDELTVDKSTMVRTMKYLFDDEAVTKVTYGAEQALSWLRNVYGMDIAAPSNYVDLRAYYNQFVDPAEMSPWTQVAALLPYH
ncbi:TPA: hypothetical protein N0F65_002999 [Lagenidium giganteum]|uniref:3'-5' exonuclease domain-containing protein n=1 Tax=Lagenidium giganteum TaxID=4803 RepID=A0AAV2YR46_9STRA|nr:TPA: hypothetical protein N0F65_002999 [Lagenidium giganteum]